METLAQGTSLEDAAREAGFEWQVELGAQRNSTRIPDRLRERLFSLPAPDGEARRAVVAGADDAIYVLEFVRLSEGGWTDLAQAERSQLQREVAGESAGLLQRQFEAALQQRADVTVY